MGELTMEGIMVGCDRHQEWLLPWWWNHYCKHNKYPVAFVDFGMSGKAAAWCRKRGRYLIFPADRYPLLFPEWKSWHKNQAIRLRSAWFSKTLAFLLAPFHVTCWIDLDCEIKGSVDLLFASLSSCRADIALVREPECFQILSRKAKAVLPGEVIYNSGVVVFRKAAKILQHSAEIAIAENDCFQSDQDVLSRAIFRFSPSLVELPPTCNWMIYEGPNPEALILHYVSTTKRAILLSLDCKQFNFV